MTASRLEGTGVQPAREAFAPGFRPPVFTKGDAKDAAGFAAYGARLLEGDLAALARLEEWRLAYLFDAMETAFRAESACYADYKREMARQGAIVPGDRDVGQRFAPLDRTSLSRIWNETARRTRSLMLSQSLVVPQCLVDTFVFGLVNAHADGDLAALEKHGTGFFGLSRLFRRNFSYGFRQYFSEGALSDPRREGRAISVAVTGIDDSVIHRARRHAEAEIEPLLRDLQALDAFTSHDPLHAMTHAATTSMVLQKFPDSDLYRNERNRPHAMRQFMDEQDFEGGEPELNPLGYEQRLIRWLGQTMAHASPDVHQAIAGHAGDFADRLDAAMRGRPVFGGLRDEDADFLLFCAASRLLRIYAPEHPLIDMLLGRLKSPDSVLLRELDNELCGGRYSVWGRRASILSAANTLERIFTRHAALEAGITGQDQGGRSLVTALARGAVLRREGRPVLADLAADRTPDRLRLARLILCLWAPDLATANVPHDPETDPARARAAKRALPQGNTLLTLADKDLRNCAAASGPARVSPEAAYR